MAARCGIIIWGLRTTVFVSIFPSSARLDEPLQGLFRLLFPTLRGSKTLSVTRIVEFSSMFPAVTAVRETPQPPPPSGC